jgi:hypothetical protein
MLGHRSFMGSPAVLSLLTVGCVTGARHERLVQPAPVHQVGATTDEPQAQAVLPAVRPRPADLLPQFLGGGPCRTDADCTVSRATVGCSFCGGCDAAMTLAEHERRAKVSCDRVVLQPVACSPCQGGPDRATCIDGECIGVLDPPRMEVQCTTDAECAHVAYEGCCACPERWMPARLSWIEQARVFCASQPCGLAPTSCSPLQRPPGRTSCVDGVCDQLNSSRR